MVLLRLGRVLNCIAMERQWYCNVKLGAAMAWLCFETTSFAKAEIGKALYSNGGARNRLAGQRKGEEWRSRAMVLL